MRKNRFCVSLLGVAVFACPLLLGFAPLATSADEPLTGSYSMYQASPPQQTWDDHFKDLVRRMRAKLGDSADSAQWSLKDSVVALQLRFQLFGLPSDLTAADLNEMELDAVALRDCAQTDPKPPLGTDFGLVVFIHDVGIDLLKAIDQY